MGEMLQQPEREKIDVWEEKERLKVLIMDSIIIFKNRVGYWPIVEVIVPGADTGDFFDVNIKSIQL